MARMSPLHEHEDKKQSLLSHIIRGTPYEFSFLGNTVQMIGRTYKWRKMKEFSDGYWERFVEGLNDIRPTMEFNTRPMVNGFNALSDLEKISVMYDCAELYAFNGKLTYANFSDVVESYASAKQPSIQDFSPDLPSA